MKTLPRVSWVAAATALWLWVGSGCSKPATTATNPAGGDAIPVSVARVETFFAVGCPFLASKSAACQHGEPIISHDLAFDGIDRVRRVHYSR